VLRDFASFLRSIWREWRSLLTGGSVIAILALWNMAGGRSISQSVNWLVLGLTLVLAAFLAWRREWISSGRGFVDVDLAGLEQLFHGRAGVHQRSIERPVLGRFIKVTGTIEDMSIEMFMAFVRIRTSAGVSVTLQFMFRWNARAFFPLPIGTRVTVAGRIISLRRRVELGNCAVISWRKPSASRRSLNSHARFGATTGGSGPAPKWTRFELNCVIVLGR
jgi:hypothetical protein